MPDLDNLTVVEGQDAVDTDTLVDDPAQDDPQFVEDPSTSDDADPIDAHDTDSGDDDADATPPRKSKGVQKRIDELVAEREAERREKERLLEIIEKMQKPAEPKPEPAPVKEPEEPEPQVEDFDDYTEYVKTWARWNSKQERKAIREEIRREEEENRRKQEQESHAQTLEQKIASARTKYPDFEQKVERVRIPVQAADVVQESEHFADVAYYIATHPEEQTALNGMTPTQAIKRIGVIESRFASTAKPPNNPKPTTPAKPSPEPQKPLGGTSSPVQDLDRADYQTYRDRQNQREAERLARR